MKLGRLLVPLLALVSSCVCFAQENRPAPDPTLRAVTQAMRDGRITDAEKLLTDAIHELEQSYDHEVPSKEIGVRVMERLHSLDEVAYIRYASVYRQFQDIGEFINEIESLGKKSKRNTQQPELFIP